MRRQLRRRPVRSPRVEFLEDRSLPASTTLGQIQAAFVREAQAGFADLAGTFVQAAATTLFAGGSSGIAANRAAFDSQIGGAINALETDLNSQLGLAPLSKDGLRQAIDGSLAGSSGSLQAMLQAIPSPTDTSGTSPDLFGSTASREIAQTLQSDLSLYQGFFSPSNPDRKSVGNVGGDPLKIINADFDKQIKTMFENLALAYSKTANTTLFTEADVSGLTAARSTFDTSIQGGVIDVIANLTSKLSLAPLAADGLIANIQQRLGGPGGLNVQLQSLATPSDLNGTTAEAFGQGAATSIASAYHDVLRMVNAFFQAPRSTSSASTGSSGGSGSNTSSGGSTSSGSGSGSTSSGSTSSSNPSSPNGQTSQTSAGTLNTTQSVETNGFLNGFNSSLGTGYGESINGTFYTGANGTILTPITTSEQSTTIAGGSNSAIISGAFNGFNSSTLGGTSVTSGTTGTTGTTGTNVGSTSSPILGTTAGNTSSTTGTGSTGGFNTGFSNGFDNGFGSNASSAFGPGYNSGFGDGSNSNFSPNEPTGTGAGTNNGATSGQSAGTVVAESVDTEDTDGVMSSVMA